LQEERYVFTYGEVKQVCPYIDVISGAVNGFGLLQVVEHSSLKGKGNIAFLYHAMQPYLAAFHVSILDDKQQACLINKTFWSECFCAMWLMYCGIVGVQSEGLTELVNFLYQGNACAKKSAYLNLKCLHLFQCYWEANNTNEFPFSLYGDGNVQLYYGPCLLLHYVTSLMFFIIKCSIQWNSLRIVSCNIDSEGMAIIQQFFLNFEDKFVSLEHIHLELNNLSSFWGTCPDEIDVNETNILLKFQSLDLHNNQLCQWRRKVGARGAGAPPTFRRDNKCIL